MRKLLSLCLLSIAALGQATPVRISPDEAVKHLIRQSAPIYPSLAEAAHIQGNVLIEISIDEAGTVSSRRLVTGHPLLAPAALDAVGKWKYQPFEVNGKPVAVVTVAMVTFGKNSNDAEDRAEMLFQHNFWSAMDSAGTALANKDYATAERELSRANGFLPQAADDRRHLRERWRWLMSMGRVRSAQQRFGDAEQSYQQALSLQEKGDKDSPEVAATLASLGAMYADEKHYDPALDYAGRSLNIYQKNFKRAGSDNPGARQAYGRAIAYQYWTLSRLALEKSDSAAAVRYCRGVLEFEDYLGPADRQPMVSGCQGTATDSMPSH